LFVGIRAQTKRNCAWSAHDLTVASSYLFNVVALRGTTTCSPRDSAYRQLGIIAAILFDFDPGSRRVCLHLLVSLLDLCWLWICLDLSISYICTKQS
jgi:hypothetical protein